MSSTLNVMNILSLIWQYDKNRLEALFILKIFSKNIILAEKLMSKSEEETRW